ncbi:hypothetical protein [Vibrio agarivorans]|uniref:hypothetical protein n=1 Tax=Vibrio agarivorans TaxID=153622 RepID=UPI002231AE91|nr:hypothetical protein [Vibrio agarivorans]
MIKRINGWLYCGVLELCLAAIIHWLVSRHRIDDMALNTSLNKSCEVAESQGERTFTIFWPSFPLAENIAKTFCELLLIYSEYSRVVVVVMPRDRLETRHMTTEAFDLIFSRHYVLNSIFPNYESFYHSLVSWPTYSVYWLSHEPLSVGRYASSKIGVLNDHRSQSGYIEPMKFLKHQNLDLDSLDIHYYDNRQALMTAFRNEKVDMIPNLTLKSDSGALSEYHETLINDRLEIGSWYVNNDIPEALLLRINGFLRLLYTESIEGQANG